MASPSTPTKAKPQDPKSFHSTPIKKNLQGSEHYASLSKPDATILHRNMASELAGQWVGPMPVDKFIEAFLPNSNKKPTFDPKFFDVLETQQYECNMYDPFIKLVTNDAPDAIQGFQLVNTSTHDDADITIPGMKNKPDVSCYKGSVVIDPARPTRYEDMELILEFKPKSNEADPFEDHPGEKERKTLFPFEAEAENRRLCRGQIASYARVWCARQHRTHCFVIWIAHAHARIIRFDRSGGIVSERFNYRANGNKLLNFLWSFSHATDSLRGLDHTVTKASDQEKAEVHDKLYQWKTSSKRSVFKVQVPDAKTGPRPFFVWGPLSDPRSVTGRATRGYAAWDPQDRRVVFLKDSWRSTEPGMEKEVDILKELHKEKCRNVPELVCGDDLDQPTATKNYVDEDWNIGAKKEDLIQRVHTRFVEKKVGSHIASDLKEMNAKKFLQIVFDAFIAHFDAYTKCQILHRDISAGNILVDKNGRGFLNDWDLSRHVDGDVSARQAFRSGTWQFMSAEVLQNPQKLQTLQDDMESFFWLILYHTLRYIKHSHPESLAENMQKIFDFQDPTPLGEEPRGGDGKTVLLMKTETFKPDFEVTGNQALTGFLASCHRYFRKWHLYIYAHKDDVQDYAMKHKISREEAEGKLPLQTANLAMDNHAAMMELFEDAFGEGAQWATGDFFIDHLRAESNKHELEEDEENGSGDDGENAVGGEGAARAKKNQKQKHDDAEYKARSGTPLPRALPPPLNRAQSKLQERGSNDSPDD